ncbi:MAG: hypothetical protein DWH78_08595 [Planctomycetota bacterium]|nr:MAG: hypothetical protein DWH78_08595 [Planctomycetota bacterium]
MSGQHNVRRNHGTVPWAEARGCHSAAAPQPIAGATLVEFEIIEPHNVATRQACLRFAADQR